MMGDYSFVIDASGAPSLTSKVYGFVPDYTRNATLLTQCAVEGDFGFVGPNTILVGYNHRYIGYYYIFPKGPDIANVGVGRFDDAKKNAGFVGRPISAKIVVHGEEKVHHGAEDRPVVAPVRVSFGILCLEKSRAGAEDYF